MIRELRYALMDPTGNQTILVETSVPVEKQPSVAAKLMELEPTAEQTGFLTVSGRGDLSLRMAGGEFCGNATMSTAAYYAANCGLAGGNFDIQVSGAQEPVPVEIRRNPDGSWTGRVGMPRPTALEYVHLPGGLTLPVVFFQGIAHVILQPDILGDSLLLRAVFMEPDSDRADASGDETPEKEAEALAKRWCAYLKTDALGLMFLRPEEERLEPLVYVPAADTLFWESSCGSGTTAVGAWLAAKAGRVMEVRLRQPGGTLELHAEPDGPYFLTGTVRCLYEKTIELACG